MCVEASADLTHTTSPQADSLIDPEAFATRSSVSASRVVSARLVRIEGQSEARDQQDALQDHKHFLARVRSSSLVEARSKHAEQPES